ncbi:hypothetical protein Pmani_013944 [Petrolisthes manimaculis]|uniref:Uncharacterized protein n=1 Tax=Petrolisthes manimaculis TaxID=1843537 RepID=A0AAE1PUZ0_9EUCA|nr:hypothetical protein Pmani_013944 [Petrolisthes manimaculis]
MEKNLETEVERKGWSSGVGENKVEEWRKGATVCHVSEPTDKDSDSNVTLSSPFINCPGPLDPANHTACCYDTLEEEEREMGNGEEDGGGGGGKGLKQNTEETERRNEMPRCCVPTVTSTGFFYIDDQLAMIIALSVTSMCVLATITIIICCFWSQCPLYTACRIRYHQDDIIAYVTKDEETAGLNDMPPEETKGVNIYSPNAVKVTLKNDV